MFDIHAKQFARSSGRSMQIGRMTVYSQITSDDTQGAYALMEASVPANSGSGLHRHWSYDEVGETAQEAQEAEDYYQSLQALITPELGL